ncbi:hypothetical protein V8B97DRAFT_2024980 [Scleroderma yunnanense]
MPPPSLTPPTSLRVSRHQICKFNRFHNTSIQHQPLLIYHSCFSAHSSAVESHLLLCIVSERAKLCFDGEENPERVETAVEKGDVIIIPAGVAHRSLEDLEGNFLMVGSYPVRKNWDMCYGSADEEGYTENIKHLEWLKRDPIYEDDGPALGA